MPTEKNKTCCISSWDRFGRKNITVCFRVSKTIRDLFISISRDKLDWGRRNNKDSFWRQTSLSGIQYNESGLKKKLIRGVKQKKKLSVYQYFRLKSWWTTPSIYHDQHKVKLSWKTLLQIFRDWMGYYLF